MAELPMIPRILAKLIRGTGGFIQVPARGVITGLCGVVRVVILSR